MIGTMLFERRLNFLAVFSLTVFLMLSVSCGGGLGREEVRHGRLVPRVKQKFSSDDTSSPFFFASIKEIRSNRKFIYVADWKSLKITIFDQNFNLVKKFGKRGNGPGEFDFIIVDMCCNDQNLYVLTLKKVIEFTAEGDYIREIVPEFRVRRIFKTRNGFLFKRDFFPVTFTQSDPNGAIVSEFFKTQEINSFECGKAYASPSVHFSQNNKVLAMSSTTYQIRQFDLDTQKEEFNISRDTQFWPVHCQKRGEGKYTFSGGFSSMLEDNENFHYFYHKSENKIGIDVYRKSDFTLLGEYDYQGEIYPRTLRVDHGDYLGSIINEGDTLYLFELVEAPEV